MDKLKLTEMASDLDTDAEENPKKSRHSRHAVGTESSDEEQCVNNEEVTLDSFPNVDLLSDAFEPSASTSNNKLDTQILATLDLPVLQSFNSTQEPVFCETKRRKISTSLKTVVQSPPLQEKSQPNVKDSTRSSKKLCKENVTYRIW